MERDGLGIWGQQMQTIIYRMDKQQGPTVQHSELYLIAWEENIKKNVYMGVTESLSCTAEINTML